MRYAEISEVLTDSTRKRTYDSLPAGKAWLDSRIRELADEGLAVGIAKKREEPEISRHFDWMSRRACRYDCSVAQRWYLALVAVAPLFGYTRSIKVLLHDDEPQWLDGGNILMIPRSWEPTRANAYALFAVKVAPHSLTL